MIAIDNKIMRKDVALSVAAVDAVVFLRNCDARAICIVMSKL